MHIAHKTAYVSLAAAVAGLYWLTLPQDRVAFDEACRPVDAPAWITATLHRQSYLESQIQIAHEAILWEERRPAASVHEAEQERQSASAAEARMERLSKAARAAPSDPDAKQQAEIDEQNQRLNQVAWLYRCEMSFRQRLGE